MIFSFSVQITFNPLTEHNPSNSLSNLQPYVSNPLSKQKRLPGMQWRNTENYKFTCHVAVQCLLKSHHFAPNVVRLGKVNAALSCML